VYKELNFLVTFVFSSLVCMAPKTHFSQHCSHPAETCNRTVGCYLCIHRRKLVVSECHQLLLLELELPSYILVIQFKHQAFLHIKMAQMAIPVLNIMFHYAQILGTSNGLVQNMHYFYVADSCFVHNMSSTAASFILCPLICFVMLGDLASLWFYSKMIILY
jgi:hypothetical protein